jgi:rod shape determining protein RodA
MAQENVSTKSLLRSIDWITVILFVLLIAAGWTCVVGASYNYGDPSILDFSARSGKQLIWICCSFLLGFILLLTDDRIYDTFANIFYLIMMGLLLITPFVAADVKGSYSWINLGPVSLQPAEFAKCATALALAKYMGSYGFSIFKTRDFLHALAIVFIPIILIILEHETGSALVYLSFFLVFYREGMSGSVLFVGLAAVVYFVVGLRYEPYQLDGTFTTVGKFTVLLLIWLFTDLLVFRYNKEKKEARNIFIAGTIITLAAYFISRKFVVFDISWAQLGICVATIVYLTIQALRKRTPRFLLMGLFMIGSLTMYYSTNYVLNDVLEPHQQTRIRVLLGLDEDVNGAGYNVRQSEIAIGSGGLEGKGFLNGTQTKLKYVPEQDTDFIFCTVGEEHGFIGSTVVLGLFLALILRLIKLAERQPFVFGRVYGYSVLSIFLFHFFINVGMVLGLTPVIGIPLPFFSYGGSSLWGFTILLFVFLRIDAGREKFRR